MDPMTIGSLISAGSSFLGKAMAPEIAPPPPQRSDGYALGGNASGGATGGAYGGAWSQANVDGSNWTVNTGGGSSVGGGKSGGNGGLSPTQSNGGVGGVGAPSPFASAQGMTINPMLIGLAVVAYLLIKH